MVVKNELEHLGFEPLNVTLGEVEIDKDLTETQIKDLDNHLKTFGFELIDDKKSRLIGQIKTSIIEIISKQKLLQLSRVND